MLKFYRIQLSFWFNWISWKLHFLERIFCNIFINHRNQVITGFWQWI